MIEIIYAISHLVVVTAASVVGVALGFGLVVLLVFFLTCILARYL